MKENYVRKAILADALELAPKMRIGDRKEIMASDGSTPLESLVLPFTQKNAKIYSIVGTQSEGVIGMFGVVPSDKDDYGVAWLLSSPELLNHTIQFLRECPKWVKEMGQDYKYLYN